MTDIDSDQHRTHVVHRFRELQVEQVTLNLRVDLPEDVAGLAHVELEAIARGDDLGGNLVLVEELLVHAVVVLVSEDDHDNLGMAEVSCRTSHHVLEQLTFNLSVVILRLHFDESWLLYVDL